jgi:mono/diheme cytochrome c family protein
MAYEGERMKRISMSVALALVAALGPACAQAQDAVDRGKQQFVAQGCYGCHTVEKFGTPIGPDLSKIGARYPQETLVRWLRDPSAVRAAHMPKLELTEDQIASLAAYLSSLR